MLKKLKDDRGSAIVEVAIMLPVVLAITVGFMLFTLAIRNDTVLQTSAREADREYAITHSTSRALHKAQNELSLGGIDPDEVDVKITATGQEQKVTIIMPYSVYVPMIGGYRPVLKGEAVFHKESPVNYN